MAEQVTQTEDIREAVRERYAAAAESVEEGRVACCGPSGTRGRLVRLRHRRPGRLWRRDVRFPALSRSTTARSFRKK